MRALLNVKVWAFFSLVWIGAMAFWCYQSWPRLPLDVSSIDPETLEIFKRAQWQHLGSHVVAALVPPILTYGIGKLICRVTGCRQG